ncbi:MAG: hypothetical protein RLZZ72_588 [Actinomycetota bacterium]|jgi:hypothetical protein
MAKKPTDCQLKNPVNKGLVEALSLCYKEMLSIGCQN